MFQTTNQYRWCSHQTCPFIGGSIPLLVDKKVPSLGTPCASERPMSTTALPLNSKRMSCPKLIDYSWCTIYGCVWKCCVARKTQWFCWSLSLLNGYFIGNIPYFQTNPLGELSVDRINRAAEPSAKPPVIEPSNPSFEPSSFKLRH